MSRRVAIVGAGLGGLSAALHLASRGVSVTVFEKTDVPGGKAGQVTLGPYRFDTGPSLVTMSFVLEELFRQTGSSLSDHLQLVSLDPVCRYHFNDGSLLDARSDTELMARSIGALAPADGRQYKRFMRYSRRIYARTSELFLFNSLSDPRSLLRFSSLATLARIWQIDPLRTMDASVRRFFHDERIIQLFDRYATYNGSDPYRAPATLNIIPYVEHELGAFYIRGGIYHLVEALVRQAERLGVEFHMESPVRAILTDGGKARGVETDKGSFSGFDAVVSNADAVYTMQQLVPKGTRRRMRMGEPSSSGLVFLWGVGKEHGDLAHHNIFFSGDYRREFREIFGELAIPTDPTVYVSITSKTDREHAPVGSENWFVLINVPSQEDGLTAQDVDRLRDRVLGRLRASGLDPSPAIEQERVIRPQDFIERFHAYRGSLYGWSSNSRSAAFLRPANRARVPRGLYLCGGAAHPGGGIPLVVLSGKIAASLCLRDLGLS